jgi:hypothetical protein
MHLLSLVAISCCVCSLLGSCFCHKTSILYDSTMRFAPLTLLSIVSVAVILSAGTGQVEGSQVQAQEPEPEPEPVEGCDPDECSPCLELLCVYCGSTPSPGERNVRRGRKNGLHRNHKQHGHDTPAPLLDCCGCRVCPTCSP